MSCIPTEATELPGSNASCETLTVRRCLNVGGMDVPPFQSFRYEVTGLEPDPFDIAVPLPAPMLTDNYRVVATIASNLQLPPLLCPDDNPTDRTPTEFHIVTGFAFPVGCKIDFFVRAAP